MLIEIDNSSGFCYGVEKTIQLAENALNEGSSVYCLGEIVHNEQEVERLRNKGLIIIEHDDLKNITHSKVLIRAHGVPPATYKQIEGHSNLIKDGTCPIVLNLQKKVRAAWEEMKETGGQIIIYGKQGHPEVTGLVGQTDGKAIVANKPEDLDKIDFSKPTALFAQTTQSKKSYDLFSNMIKEKMLHFFSFETLPLKITDSICRYVSNRGEHIKEFAQKYDVIIFVSGTSSSNGKILYDVCLNNNPNSFLVSNADEVKREWFEHAASVGICSATSTPRWLMDVIAERIKNLTLN
jgi:4-hydroxy-3-methylbut-2-en-1-yl diphosphate reductase